MPLKFFIDDMEKHNFYDSNIAFPRISVWSSLNQHFTCSLTKHKGSPGRYTNMNYKPNILKHSTEMSQI